MVRRKIGTTLASCGMVMLLFGLSALPARGAEPVRVALQPSPRPAIEPLSSNKGEPTVMGHITGTVIDATTGASAPGVPVQIGGEVVISDANGNYDHWLPVGAYTVTLTLAQSQGIAEQGPVDVVVQPEVTTVQHLNFRSPAALAVEPAPVVAEQPAAPAVQSAPEAVAPESAPETAAPEAPHNTPPKSLPRTGSESYGGWLWLGFGMLLLLAGGLVGFGPVMGGRSPALILQRQAANMSLLRGLLSAPAQSAPRRPKTRPAPQREDLLAELLDVKRERKQ